jgi:hypothetical protein
MTEARTKKIIKYRTRKEYASTSRLEKKPIPIHCAHSPERSEPDDAAVLNLNPVNIENKNKLKQERKELLVFGHNMKTNKRLNGHGETLMIA